MTKTVEIRIIPTGTLEELEEREKHLFTQLELILAELKMVQVRIKELKKNG